MKPLSAEDVVEIQDLHARYCVTTDNADADAFMQTWVAPAEFGGYDSGAFGRMETWQQLYEFEKDHVRPGGGANGKRHLSLNLVIEPVSATEARTSSDMVVLETVEPPRIIATGRYNGSVVVKTAQGWRFKSRSLQVDPGFFKWMQQAQGDRPEGARGAVPQTSSATT